MQPDVPLLWPFMAPYVLPWMLDLIVFEKPTEMLFDVLYGLNALLPCFFPGDLNID